jgi:transcription-repair coupling factor (superfamily II helicase)
LGVTTEINLHVPALLPSLYCADVHERLVMAKRLASADTKAELDSIQGVGRSLVRRRIPRKHCFCHRLRLTAKELGVARSTPDLNARRSSSSAAAVRSRQLDPHGARRPHSLSWQD